MKVSANSRYALRILIDLALFPEGLRSIKDIAQSQNLSEKFISCIIVKLRKAGLLKSVRGIQGGLKLAKDPKEITLYNIVEIMEGSVSILDCLKNPQQCINNKKCIVIPYWERVNKELIQSLQAITLAEILDNAKTKNNL